MIPRTLRPHVHCAAVLLVLLSLTGCAERVAERQGAQMSVVPVTQTLSLTAQSSSLQGAKNEISAFIAQHFATIHAKGVQVTWRGARGQQLFAYAKQEAAKHGLAPAQLVWHDTALSQGEDIRFVFTDYKVMVPLCRYEQVGKFGWNDSSCYTDSARWQSMVNPEKMLPVKYVK